MFNVKIGDTVLLGTFRVRIGDTITLCTPSGATREIIVTDVIRDYAGAALAIAFQGNNGPAQLPASFFQ